MGGTENTGDGSPWGGDSLLMGGSPPPILDNPVLLINVLTIQVIIKTTTIINIPEELILYDKLSHAVYLNPIQGGLLIPAERRGRGWKSLSP